MINERSSLPTRMAHALYLVLADAIRPAYALYVNASAPAQKVHA